MFCVSSTTIQGGLYVFQVYDQYSCSGTSLLLLSICQSVAIGWVYGSNPTSSSVLSLTRFLKLGTLCTTVVIAYVVLIRTTRAKPTIPVRLMSQDVVALAERLDDNSEQFCPLSLPIKLYTNYMVGSSKMSTQKKKARLLLNSLIMSTQL